jgi:starch synthase
MTLVPLGDPTAPSERQPVVHLCAEYWPFARTGGLAEAVRGIATYQAISGRPTAVVMPLFRSVRERFDGIRPTGLRESVRMGGRIETGALYEYPVPEGNVRVFFVEHDDYFERGGIYGEGGGDYPDNFRRFGFFSRFVAEVVLPRLAHGPFVLHGHDWHTALALVYLRTVLADTAAARRSATVLTVHNAGYQGHFGTEVLAELGLPRSLYDWRYMEWYDRVNILKGGMAFSDMVTTVSPAHALELCTPDGGFGLHDAFADLGPRLVGVLNGIDQGVWDPATDPEIAAPFDAADLSGKAVCKAWLQEALHLPIDPDVPLFGMAARIVEQKGFDLILGSQVMGRLPAQFLFVGEGDPRYQNALARFAARFRDRIATRFEFTERREHRMIAGCDALLMPSQYEPCGLTQMRSQRYGTLPLVRSVGGLADTVTDDVTGFQFDAYTSAAFDGALVRAVERYEDADAWQAMMHEAMAHDFSWPRRVREYDAVYASALGEAGLAV